MRRSSLVHLVGEVSPYAAIFLHRAVRSARRDEGKYAATPSAGTPRNAPQFLSNRKFLCLKTGAFTHNWNLRWQACQHKYRVMGAAQIENVDDLAQIEWNAVVFSV